MISTKEREEVEKSRSALEASHATDSLLVPEETISRYIAPSEDTVYPLEYAFHLLGDVRGQTVLEYGCGDGLNTVVLARRGAKVIGLDISPELLELAKQRMNANRCNATTFVLGSAHALPLPDESVDVIFGMAILHHLDLPMASREIHRVLKRGGKAIFKEPIRNSRLLGQIRRFLPQSADVSPYERPLTDIELKEFASPHEYRAKTFQLILSRLVSLFPDSRWQRSCAQIDALLIDRCPPLAYFGAVKVFEVSKQ